MNFSNINIKGSIIKVKQLFLHYLKQITISSDALCPVQEIRDSLVINKNGEVILFLKINGIFE